MTFITSTITSANPAADMYTALASALAAEGYQLVDTVVISTRTHKVWKCPAANNSAGVDFYLDVAYTTAGTGTLQITPFEDYNATTHVAYRGPMALGGLTLDSATGTANGSTGAALESASSTIHAGTTTPIRFAALPSTSFGYWLSVTPDRVIGLTSIAPGVVLYSGLYTPSPEYAAAAGAGLIPLVTAYLWSSSSSASSGSFTSSSSSNSSSNIGASYVGMTRIYPGSGTTNGLSYCYLISRGNEALRPQVPSGSTALYPRVGVGVDLWAGIGFNHQGRFGALKDVMSAWVSASVVRGDTISIAGDATQWRMSTGDGNGKALLFRAA